MPPLAASPSALAWATTAVNGLRPDHRARRSGPPVVARGGLLSHARATSAPNTSPTFAVRWMSPVEIGCLLSHRDHARLQVIKPPKMPAGGVRLARCDIPGARV